MNYNIYQFIININATHSCHNTKLGEIAEQIGRNC